MFKMSQFNKDGDFIGFNKRNVIMSINNVEGKNNVGGKNNVEVKNDDV